MKVALNIAVSFACAVCVFLAGIVPAFAQEALSVTITPPLFQLTVGPGESWTSNVKVVNNNTYPVSYKAQVVDFEAQGETGQGKFVPLIESFADAPAQGNSLGSWIEISKDPVLIQAGESAQIEFTVRVPANADPGGHYAAIMIGPSSEDTESGSHMKVSSFVTSLLFVRIKGDIVESGRIREFTTEKTLYQTPEANFVLRFENTGNTHLRPQGSITLYNMYGKERGQVFINEKSNFGNVLPRSIRKFQFSWSGEESILDIGRYSAVVTLGYGDNGKQNASATTYFWVVPIIPVSITLGIALAFILTMTWFIRRYIRRALSLERIHMGIVEHPNVPDRQIVAPQQISTIRALVQPIKEGVVDLRSVGSASQVPQMKLETPDYVAPLTFGQFVSKYKLFFMFLVVLVLIVTGVVMYFRTVLVPHRDFQIQELKAEEAKLAE